MVTLSLTATPASVPSWGVTSQVTSSPVEKAPLSVVPVPTGVPLTVHWRVEASPSPSASA